MSVKNCYKIWHVIKLHGPVGKRWDGSVVWMTAQQLLVAQLTNPDIVFEIIDKNEISETYKNQLNDVLSKSSLTYSLHNAINTM